MQPQSQGGPFAKLITSLLFIAVGVIALFFGAIIVAVLVGFVAVFFIFLYFRAWWLRRKLGLNLHPRHSRKEQDAGITIEGEYTVEGDDKDSHRHI